MKRILYLLSALSFAVIISSYLMNSNVIADEKKTAAKSAETYEMSEYDRMADTIIALVSTNVRPDAWDATDVLKLSTSLRDDNPCKYYLTVSASIIYGKKTRLFLLAPLGACGIRFYNSVSLDLYGDMIYIIFWKTMI